MIVYKGTLLKKSSNRKSELVLSTLVTTWLSDITFHLRPILAASFGCYRFRTMPDIVSKHLRAAISSSCAFRIESDPTPFPGTGRQLKSAALHRIRLGIMRVCSYVILLLRDQ